MTFRVVAHDIDGTITDSGEVSEATYEAIRQLKAARPDVQLWAITGRSADCFLYKPTLRAENIVIPRDRLHELWDLVIADNGGTLIFPKTGKVIPLAEKLKPELVAALRDGGVDPLWVGETMVASMRNNHRRMRSIMRRVGVGSSVDTEFNRKFVMYMTRTTRGQRVNKALGLRIACKMTGQKLRDVIGFGDAENDFSFLRICGLGVAVGDAEVKLRDITGMTATLPAGAGFRQILGLLRRNQPLALPGAAGQLAA